MKNKKRMRLLFTLEDFIDQAIDSTSGDYVKFECAEAKLLASKLEEDLTNAKNTLRKLKKLEIRRQSRT